MTKRSVSRGSFERCGFCSAPSLIDERYKRGVLCALAKFGVVRFNWGLGGLRDIESWDPALKFVEAEYYVNQELRRWGWAVLLNLIPPLAKGAKMLLYGIRQERPSK